MKAVVYEVPCGLAVTSAPDPEPGPGERRLLASGRDRLLGGSAAACPKTAVAS
jgi:hypothetical protein